MPNTTHSASSPAQPSQQGRPHYQAVRHQPAQAMSGDLQQEDFSQLVSDISTAVTRYCSRRPQVAAGVLFSLGFVVGWKLRPW